MPGNVTSDGSRGGNGLIKEGAKLVERVEDILEELNLDLPAPGVLAPPSFALTPKEAELYVLLCRGPLQIDDIIVQGELPAGEVSAILLGLELKGAVTRLPGGHYAVT